MTAPGDDIGAGRAVTAAGAGVVAPAAPPGLGAGATVEIWEPRTRVVAGPGAIRWGAAELAGRALVLTDPVVAGLPVLRRVRRCLAAAGVRTRLAVVDTGFPSVRDVEHLTAQAEAADPDVLVGVGGGTVMDVAKCVAVGGTALWRDVVHAIETTGAGWIPLPAAGTRWPVTLVPTTVGTGSEVNPVASLLDATGRKRLVGGPPLRAEQAVLDPLSTASLPRHLVAEGLFEIAARTLGGYLVDEDRPVADAEAATLLRGVLALAADMASTGALDAAARLDLARWSVLSHVGFSALGRPGFSAALWYLGDQVAPALGRRKVAVLAALWGPFLTALAAGRFPGSPHQRDRLDRLVRTLGSSGPTARVAAPAALASLPARLGIDQDPELTTALRRDAGRLASLTWATWGDTALAAGSEAAVAGFYASVP